MTVLYIYSKFAVRQTPARRSTAVLSDGGARTCHLCGSASVGGAGADRTAPTRWPLLARISVGYIVFFSATCGFRGVQGPHCHP